MPAFPDRRGLSLPQIEPYPLRGDEAREQSPPAAQAAGAWVICGHDDAQWRTLRTGAEYYD